MLVRDLCDGDTVWSMPGRRGNIGTQSGRPTASAPHVAGDVSEFRIVTITTGDSRDRFGKARRCGIQAPRGRPDSQSLAFVVKPPQKDDAYEHRVASIAKASKALWSTRCTAPAVTWSPDSRRLAYVVSAAVANTIRIKTPGVEDAATIELPKEKPDVVTLDMWLPTGSSNMYRPSAHMTTTSSRVRRNACARMFEGRGSSGGDGWISRSHARTCPEAEAEYASEHQRRLRAPVDPGSGLSNDRAWVLS